MALRKENVFGLIDAPSFDPIEVAPLSEVRALQEQRLREQMVYLKAHSPMYRRLFERERISVDDVKTIEDLARVPFTVKQDLRDSLKEAPPYGLHGAVPLRDVVQMQASSGTTGSPAYVALTESDLDSWREVTARCFFSGGVRPGDMVLHAFSMAKGFVGGLPIFQALQYMGAIDVPIGADGGADRLLVACRDMRPRAIVAAPNFARFLGEACEELIGVSARDLGVERVVVGG